MNKVIVLLMILCVSCGSLPMDNTPAPIDSGFWNLELDFENQISLGLSGALYSQGDSRVLSIPLFHKGTLSINSTRCNYSLSEHYSSKQSKSKQVKLKDLFKNKPQNEFACIFNILVFIDGFDKGFQGQFYLVKKENFTYVKSSILAKEFHGVISLQVRETANMNTPIKFHVRNSGTFFFQGCGHMGEMKFEGTFEVPLKYIVGDTPLPCAYTLGFEFADGTKGISEFNFKTFSTGYIQLENPLISYKGKSLKTIASSPVGYTSLNGRVKKGIKNRTRVKGNIEVIYRSLTANGRYSVLKIKNGGISWEPLVIY